MLRKITFIVLLIVAISFSGVYAQEDSETVGIDALCGEGALELVTVEAPPEDEQTLALDALMRQFVTDPAATELSTFAPKPPAPGAVVLVDSPAGRYFKAIGVADVETCEPLQPTMPFAIGSNTKMFTAAVVYQLQEEGLLSTDDLVVDYLPDEIALFEGAETSTIDMLLTHTSGLPDYFNSQNPESFAVLVADPESGLLTTPFTPLELIENAVISDPMKFEPGAEGQWAYSNTGYIMLGQIIEQVTGKTYNEVVAERIIEPLSLQNTVLVEDIAAPELGLPSSYLQSPFTFETTGWSYTQAYSAGNIVSTAEDMAVFLRALYSGALYQNPETLDAMLTRAAPGYSQESDNFYYMHGGYYKHGFLGHGGQTLGFVSDIGYNPAYDAVIVTWANSAEAPTAYGLYHVGQRLGLTPSFDDTLTEIFAGPASPGLPEMVTLTLQDAIGTTFSLDSVYVAATGEIVVPEDGSAYTVELRADGTMTIVADCNTVQATYTTGDEGAFTIDLSASTLVACPEGSLSDQVLALLSDVSSVLISGSEGEQTLSFTTSDGSVVAFVYSQ